MRLKLIDAYTCRNDYESFCDPQGNDCSEETHEDYDIPSHTPSHTPSPPHKETKQQYVNNITSTVCNIGQFIPIETCQLYFAPTGSVNSFCMNNKFIFTIFSWNSCQVLREYQNLFSMYIKTVDNNKFEPIKTGPPYYYGMFTATNSSSNWSNIKISTQQEEIDYWIVYREYSLTSDNPTIFPPQPQPAQVGNEKCTDSVRKQNCLDTTGSPSVKSKETGSPSNLPTPMQTCQKSAKGMLFFIAPIQNKGYYCNNCDLYYQMDPSNSYSKQIAGRRINYNNIINLCNQTTMNANLVSTCNNLCKPPSTKNR